MISDTLFPRLGRDRAQVLRQGILSNNQELQAFSHDRLVDAVADPGTFPSTGGVPLSVAGLDELRLACVLAVESARSGSSGAYGAAFDLNVGRALFNNTRDVRGEMGDPRVWDFLTLVLLPDLAVDRLGQNVDQLAPSAATRDRLTGGHRRHVFQRLWKRWTVFGPTLVESSRLTEDDYVQLLERRLTGDRGALAKPVAQLILESGLEGTARRDYARALMRHLLQLSGIVHIGTDSPEFLDDLIDHLRQTTPKPDSVS